MSLVAVLGWWCAALGSVSLFPQTLKLLRDRDTDGIALPFWQITLGLTVAWAHHGVVIGAPNMIAPNLLMAASAALTLWLVCRDRRQSPLRSYGTAAALAAVLMGADLLFGAVTFGLLAMVPAVSGSVAQLLEVVRASTLTGVSRGFLVLAVGVQASWLSWGLLVGDPSTMINSSLLTGVTSLTLAVYLVRGRSLPTAERLPVECGDPA